MNNDLTFFTNEPERSIIYNAINDYEKRQKHEQHTLNNVF